VSDSDLPPPSSSRIVRLTLMGFGWICIALGIVGAVLPVLPTTPFLLLAVWAFARSSPFFHQWLLHHRLFGPLLSQWERHRVIPIRAKIFAVTGMAGGMVWVTVFSQAPWYAAVLMGGTVAFGAWFVLSKPSAPPP
jgi:uncharacterized membrane protein YbaN (DUF454 family)